MSHIRLIARLDVKGSHLIKSVRLEGLRKLGDPQEFAQRYYNAGIDEIIYMDVVASLYEREGMRELVRRTTENVFIPLTVGGGLRSVDDVRAMLRAGADKVAINTAAVKRPQLITEVAQQFGSQCMVLSIEAKLIGDGKWEVYTDNGRERTGLSVIDWAQRAVELGAGEILLTSVDHEGTQLGLNLELIRAVTKVVPVPVIASGGVGNVRHIIDGVQQANADAIAMAHVLHYKKLDLGDIRQALPEAGINIRRI